MRDCGARRQGMQGLRAPHSGGIQMSVSTRRATEWKLGTGREEEEGGNGAQVKPPPSFRRRSGLVDWVGVCRPCPRGHALSRRAQTVPLVGLEDMECDSDDERPMLCYVVFRTFVLLLM